jgi:hypothetical protein
MKSFVLEKTRYIVNNSWFGLLLPAGVHQLLNLSEKNMPERPVNSYRAHPAESRMLRNPGSKVKP